jgi:hypothetical protein
MRFSIPRSSSTIADMNTHDHRHCSRRQVLATALAISLLILGHAATAEDKLVTKVFAIPPDLVDEAHGSLSPQKLAKSGILTSPKIYLPPGAGSVIDRKANQIAIRNTEDSIKKTELLIAEWNKAWKENLKRLIYFDEVTFAVSPRQRIGKLESATYRLPPGTAISDLVAELKAQGVLFPEGSEARFETQTQVATIRQTTPNLDLCVSYFASLWRLSNRVPPFQDKAPSPVQIEAGAVDQTLRDLAASKLPTR